MPPWLYIMGGVGRGTNWHIIAWNTLVPGWVGEPINTSFNIMSRDSRGINWRTEVNIVGWEGRTTIINQHIEYHCLAVNSIGGDWGYISMMCWLILIPSPPTYQQGAWMAALKMAVWQWPNLWCLHGEKNCDAVHVLSKCFFLRCWGQPRPPYPPMSPSYLEVVSNKAMHGCMGMN